MKRLIVGILIVGILGYGGWSAYHYYYGGTDYYGHVNQGQRAYEKDDNGKRYVLHQYKIKAYDADGHQKVLKFNANQDQPLKVGAYLRLTVNQTKGVTSWERIKQQAVPNEAMKQLH